MAVVYRPCYCTREQVRRALDIRQAAYNTDQIDRAIQAAAETVEDQCQRKFFPEDGTKKFDWPNFQFAYPWRLWLDAKELAATPTLVTTGSLLPSPIVIPSTGYILHPVNDGPPFTHIELRRDQNFAFGYNSTPQLDIAITGTFGYWTKTRAAGTLAASMGSGDLTAQLSDGVSAGVGDVLIADSERMIVSDMQYTNTSITYSGLSSASANDNVVTVPSGNFVSGEIILVDSEWLLIQAVYGSTFVVKRAWGGSVLASHTGGNIWANRLASVLRGQLGTTAAAHLNSAPLSVTETPGLIRELAIAESLVWMVSEPGGYSQATGGLGAGSGLGVTLGSTSRGTIKEGVPGIGLPTLRDQVAQSRYCRKARSRVI